MSDSAGAGAELAALLGALADGVLVVGADRVVRMANPQSHRLLGHEVLVGRPVTEVLSAPESLMIDPWAPLGAATDAPGPAVEMAARRPDGSTVSVRLSVAPAQLADDRVVVATLRRVTGDERHPSERLAAVVRSSPDAMVSMDLTGLITSWNDGAERMYGYPATEAIGRRVTVLMDDGPRAEMEEMLARISRGEVVAQFETDRLSRGGPAIRVSLSASPVRDEEGAIVGVATVARDVTERAEIEAELRRSNHDLEQFAYVASHDLSEPLRVIAGFVELLARRYRGALDEDADRFIGFIISGVERMQTLIDDLLAYSRAGRAEIERQPVDVGTVVRDVLWALEPQLRERRAQVDVAPLPTVAAEKGMLRQIFQNLISNAIKFGDPDLPTVRVRAQRVAAGWRFDIEDNGDGIEPRHTERVFEMFQRLHSRDVPGSGMGLAIVKRLTERLGGRVSVTAAEPKGSIFSVTIPDR